MASDCRDTPCGATLASCAPAEEGERDEGIPDFMWPNLSVTMMKLEIFDALTNVAWVAPRTRLSAERAGKYPASPEKLGDPPSMEREIPRLAYYTSQEAERGSG